MHLEEGILESIGLSLKLAFWVWALLLIFGTPLAYAIGRGVRTVFRGILVLPLAFPPTVLGFYWLLLFGESGWLQEYSFFTVPLKLVFTFEGLVLASVFSVAPYFLLPTAEATANLKQEYFDVAKTLGYSSTKQFFHVGLPLLLPQILGNSLLVFAQMLGSFGLVFMIGGGIPGETKVLSIALYEYVELMEYEKAHSIALFLLCVSTSLLLLGRGLLQQFLD